MTHRQAVAELTAHDCDGELRERYFPPVTGTRVYDCLKCGWAFGFVGDRLYWVDRTRGVLRPAGPEEGGAG